MTEPLSAALLGDYEVGLLDLLTEAITAGNAVSATRFAVDPANHDQTELDDSRRCVEALVRRHWNHLVARGLIRGECVVTWHPDTGVPQILAATPLPEEGYSPEQVARQLSSAAAGDCWDPAEEPLTNGLFIDSGLEVGIDGSHGAILGDLDGDGDLDALVPNRLGDSPSTVYINRCAARPFRRGECNGDTNINFGDVLFLLDYLFKSNQSLNCHDAADVNDDGSNNIIDVFSILAYFFNGAVAPPVPFNSCGFDPTDDDLVFVESKEHALEMIEFNDQTGHNNTGCLG
jgi:hypothetical protein